MDLVRIAHYVVGVKDTRTGVELTIERTAPPSQEELAKVLHNELGYEVVVDLKDNVISLAPKSRPREGLLAFRRRMWGLFYPWADSAHLDDEILNLPNE